MNRKIAVNIEIEDQFLKDVMVTAVEGGINYWSEVKSAHRDSELYYLSVTISEYEQSASISKYIVPFEKLADGIETILNKKSATPDWYVSKILSAIINNDSGEIDAVLADIIFQATIFKEIVYG